MDTRLFENLNNVQQDYIAPFLWLHNEDDKDIIDTIQHIYDCGIRSLCLESRTHEEFCRDDWWSDIDIIFKKCQELGMKVWILDDKHFPSGCANGIFEENHSHLHPFGVTEYHIDVKGPVKCGSAMADCWLFEDDDEILSVVALKASTDGNGYTDLIDITDGLSDGMVYFDLPEGIFRIVFIVKTKVGISKRFRTYTDMLNPEMTELYIKEVYESHYERFSEFFGNTFLGFFSDEPAFHNNSQRGFDCQIGSPFEHHPWHDKLKNMLNIADLAGLWFDIENVSDKIRYTYMDMISKEFQKNYTDKLGNWCRAHNIMYIGHIIEDNHLHAKTNSGPAHYFRALNGQDMAGIDVVLHQIVPGLSECSNAGYVSYKHMNNEFFNYYLAKLCSSFAHIDSKKKGRAMCEIFGAYGWAEGTKIMKYLMDHMLVRGINYFVPHAFSPKPNDTDCPPNFYDAGCNPQYRFFEKNMAYLNRMSHMLSDGMHISTCAILYDAENHWLNGSFLPLEKIAKKLSDNLLDFDIIPADYLDKIIDSSLNGEKYNFLIVPYAKTFPEDILKKLKKADIKIITVSKDVVECPFENVTLDALPDYMYKHNFYDVKASYDKTCLKYYHYTRNNSHIYMFVNEDIDNTITTSLKLSCFNGGKYIEYDGFENKATIKHSEDLIDISIPPYNSLMIILGDVKDLQIEEYTQKTYKEEKIINPEFKISIAERNEEIFKPYKTSDKLFNITGKGELPYFSGHIKYETEIELENKDYILDLGYVGEAAEVYLNKKLIAKKQFPPYRFEISKDDICEKNQLLIIVSNHNGYSKRDAFSKYLLFEASGILGPIKLFEKIN